MKPTLATLDADVITALTAAQSPQPPHEALADRVKARVLASIMLDDAHLTVQKAQDSWRDFLAGIQIKVLNESDGIMSYLLRLSPGAVIPPHHHPADEECMVLEGDLLIGDLLVPAGGFHMARKGVPHARITTTTGATIYLRGARPSAEHLAV
jgi:quercetin dioxygenase-like cupin family protein